jgi:type VI secretion system protein VasD
MGSTRLGGEQIGPRVSARGRWLAFALLCAAALSPVAHAADKVKVKGTLTAAAELNPDFRGRPSPAVLILFQLGSADTFKNADFASLYDPKAPAIAGDLLAPPLQMTVQPGDMRPLELELDEGARFRGVVGAYRDLEHAEWRAVVPLPEKGFFKKVFSRQKLAIALEALALSAKLE